jgi:hypothetical protein
MKRNLSCLIFATLVILLAIATNSSAVTVTTATDYFDTGIGDYDFVSGSESVSSPGQVMEVLGGSMGTLQSDGSESDSRSWDMSYLWNTLDSGGMTSGTKLVFGFGINETGMIGSNSVTIDSLNMTFNRASNPAETFSLGIDSITVFNYEQGQDTAEARIAVDLGFDFMQEYNGVSTEQFTISSNISNTSDGYEIYFLSSAYTMAVVPEPISSTLFIVGAGTLGFRRFWKKFKK